MVSLVSQPLPVALLYIRREAGVLSSAFTACFSLRLAEPVSVSVPQSVTRRPNVLDGGQEM